MLYTTLNINKARQSDIISAQEQVTLQPGLLDYLFDVITEILSAVARPLKTQRQYGTVLHAD